MVGNDHELTLSETKTNPKTEVGKNTKLTIGTYTKKTYRKPS